MLLMMACAALANDIEHIRAVELVLIQSIGNPKQSDLPFISTLEIDRENKWFTRSSGRALLNINTDANSAYDSAIKYNIGSFYKSDNPRARMIFNLKEPFTQTLFSLGYDNGMKSQKLDISRSWFAGVARAFELQTHSHLIVSMGAWLGEKVKERPCYDSYDREYWCPNLTAWSDRTVMPNAHERFWQFRYLHLF